MRKKNGIAMIGMIVMIIGVFVLFNVQLSAEEAVGQSIFTNIETTHPYEAPAVGKTLIWFKTIDQPGAAWIKIHFSKFQLNQDDYVNLRDRNGRLIEQIKGKNVSREAHSIFNVKRNGDKTFNFWGPAVDGDKVTVELFSTPNANNGLGFTIDEIGIGSISLYEKELGPIYNYDETTDADSLPLPGKNGLDFQLNQMITPGKSIENMGKMLYKKGTTWYTCKGALLDGSPNEYLPREDCINSQEVADTLEVRFYFKCDKYDFPIYQSFQGDKYIANYFDFEHGLVKLNRNTEMGGNNQKIGYIKSPCLNCGCYDFYCGECSQTHCCCTCHCCN